MKTALVTGGSGGIGKRICRQLDNLGYRVAVGYNQNRSSADELCRILREAFPVYCDLADPLRPEKAMELVKKRYGRVDILVNCRGISFYGLIQEMPPEEIDRLIDIDFRGVIYSCRRAAKYMVPAHSGLIINISSVWGTCGASCEAVYSACKGGVTAFTKALAKELGPSGIRVNRISPGVIDTSMLDIFTDEDKKSLVHDTPLGRLGVPEDVAQAVKFLVEDTFVTGRNIPVDGGFGL